MKRGAIQYGVVALVWGFGAMVFTAGIFSLPAAIMCGWYWALLFPGCLFIVGVMVYVMEKFE